MFVKFFISAILLLANYPIFAANILAKSWLIADGDGNILESENIEVKQPIASITKLMTAMIVLDANENMTSEIPGKRLRGLAVNRQQLLDLAVIKSDNQAADMLCKIYRRGYAGCIEDMNHKAKILGMYDTEFRDSTGLNNGNVSTARDLIILLKATEKYSEIVYASNQAVGEIVNKRKRKWAIWRYTNTNPLVAKYNVIVSKTGYVRLSGGCLVMSAVINGQKRLFVVLNSKTTRTRIHDMEQLILSAAAQN
jgi:serine-type D-Ala-D-Ala endopeptidase (penicillin-binding protein 7)